MAYALKVKYKSSLFFLSFHNFSDKYFLGISHFPIYVSCLAYLIFLIYIFKVCHPRLCV